MPEQIRLFYDYVEVVADDLAGMQTDRQDALDHVVSDTVLSGNGYWGFSCSNPTATDVLVGNGRLYYGGKVYFNDTSGGAAIPLATLRPALQSKIIAIVAVPKDQQSDTEQRDYETDATTNPPTYQPKAVALLQQRWADLQAQDGPESVSPAKPVPPATGVVIAYVTMTTAGITGITMVTDNQVPNLDDVDERTAELEGEFEDVEARTKTIADDIAALKAELAALAGLGLVYSLAADVARLKAKANLPASYVNYRENDFTDASQSDPTYSGYSANIDGGLRFAADAVNETQLQLFNPFDPLAKVSGAGLMLPAYTTQIFRIVKGNAGTMSLTQYSYQTVGLVQATMSRYRVRYGAEFEEAANSSFFSGGTFASPINGVASAFEKDGETFQVYDTGQVNPDGYEIYRLANYWTDTVTAAYWQRLTTAGSATGYAWGQTFVQNQGGWCTGISPKISAKPTTGTITVGISGTVNGQPDLTNIITQVTLNASDVVVEAPLGTWVVPTEPFYMEAGGRYGYFLITGAAYSVDVADITSNGGGTCFYMLDGGVWYPNPSQNIMFDLQFASFTQNQVSINLGSLSLSGGIAAIDILADAIIPPNAELTYEIQINGVWTALAEMSQSALLGLPPLVPLRATSTGTANLMPGLKLAGSVCTVSRPKTTFKEASIAGTLASASSKISIKSTLIDFDPAHHTFVSKINTGGTLHTPDTSTDVVVDSRTIERTQVFNLPAPVTSYVSELDGTSDNAANLFHGASTFELAA